MTGFITSRMYWRSHGDSNPGIYRERAVYRKPVSLRHHYLISKKRNSITNLTHILRHVQTCLYMPSYGKFCPLRDILNRGIRDAVGSYKLREI